MSFPVSHQDIIILYWSVCYQGMPEFWSHWLCMLQNNLSNTVERSTHFKVLYSNDFKSMNWERTKHKTNRFYFFSKQKQSPLNNLFYSDRTSFGKIFCVTSQTSFVAKRIKIVLNNNVCNISCSSYIKFSIPWPRNCHVIPVFSTGVEPPKF